MSKQEGSPGTPNIRKCVKRRGKYQRAFIIVARPLQKLEIKKKVNMFQPLGHI